MERYLLGSGWRKMTLSERAEKLASVENYPECCRLKKKPMFLSHPDIFLNVIFRDLRLYGVETHLPRTDGHSYDPGYLYYATYSDVDACGDKRDFDGAGETEKEDYYQSNLRLIKKYWQEKGHSSLEK